MFSPYIPPSLSSARCDIILHYKSAASIMEEDAVEQGNAPLGAQTMSKNALKKLAKKERWEAERGVRIERRRQRRADKRRRHAEQVSTGDETQQRVLSREQQRRQLLRETPQQPSSLRILIDCAFDELMTEREIVSITSQVTRCYSDNRLALHPAQLLVAPFSGRMAQRMRTVLGNQHEKWARVTMFEDKDVADLIAHTGDQQSEERPLLKGDLVYLTADTDYEMTEVDESKVYIIGGIVDKNRHKYLCKRKAESLGIATAALPIGQYIAMSHRKVLTVNHVNEILLRWLELRDWKAAFEAVIPTRKLKTDDSE